MKNMESSTTRSIVDALTRAIVDHRLQPGTKLAEQKLADHFGVSRTLVRQALFQLAQNKLIRLEPARGAFVAAPAVDEAKQVFAVRRMLEAEMTREFVRTVTPAKIKALKEHVALEKSAVSGEDVSGRTELLGDFHVRMAELMGNQVLAQIFLFEQKFATLSAEKKAERLTVEVLPKKLDEEVALEMVKGFGGVVTQLTKPQADYIGVPVEGPFKPDSYRY